MNEIKKAIERVKQEFSYMPNYHEAFPKLKQSLEILISIAEQQVNSGLQMNNTATDVSRVFGEGYRQGFEDCRNKLNNGWIPTSDRLPEIRHYEEGEPIEYNIMLQGGTVATTGCINQDGTWGWMDWCNLKFNVIGVDVIAWQPLPEPYITQSSKYD